MATLKSALGTILALVCAVTFALAPEKASAICGDIDSSGSISATDALKLLKKASGQNIELTCDACPACEVCEVCPEPTVCVMRPSQLRLYNDWYCPSGSSTATLRSSTGESWQAGTASFSAYQTFDHDVVQWAEWSQCGETIRFDGPFTIPRERKMHVELLALDPYFISGNPNDLFWYLTLIDDGPRPGGNFLLSGDSSEEPTEVLRVIGPRVGN